VYGHGKNAVICCYLGVAVNLMFHLNIASSSLD
jgi:hypothetical protein